jgi:hypothetical protein
VNFASDIKELILLHEGVILPGLGGFVTSYHPAEIHKDTHLIQPPSVKVSFDGRMLTDNGLLISHIARRNKFSEEEARVKVNEYIDELKNELDEKGSVSIEEVGVILKAPGGELTFKAVADKNYRLQSFGLPSIEVHNPVKSAEMKPPVIPSPPAPVTKQKRKKLPLAALITFLVLLAAGLVYFTGIFDRYMKSLFLSNKPASADSLGTSNKIVFGQQVPAEKDSLSQEVNQQLTDNTSKEKALYYQEPAKALPEPKKTQIQETRAPAVIPQNATPQVIQSGNFYIVAGSFLKPGNADRQKAELEKKGYNPRIVRKNDNFYYVTLQSYNSKDAALPDMRKMARDLDLPLWVMHK